MSGTIILWISLIWLPVLLFLLLRNETKWKKGIAAGVTFPYEGQQHPEVQARLRRFRKQIGWVCLGLVAAALPCLFLPSFSLSFALWGTWLFACILLPYVPYVLCNRDLKRLKQVHGWDRLWQQPAPIPKEAIPPFRRLPVWFFLPPVLLSLLPLLWDNTLWPSSVIMALCQVLFFLCYRYTYRDRPEQVGENLDRTKALTALRRRNWNLVWGVCAYCLAGCSLVLGLPPLQGLPALLLFFALAILMTAVCLAAEFRTRKQQETLSQSVGGDPYPDEDDRWLLGLFYYNPKDRHLFVNARTGLNTTVNLARPAGKVLTALGLACLLALPFLGPALNAYAQTPLLLTVTSQEITAGQNGKDYTLSCTQVASAQLLDELPRQMTRTYGTGMDTLLKGTFSSPSLGSVQVALDPTCPPFLLLTTHDGRHYLFGTRTPQGTVRCYEAILASL